jgi:hypothetical protein
LRAEGFSAEGASMKLTLDGGLAPVPVPDGVAAAATDSHKALAHAPATSCSKMPMAFLLNAFFYLPTW